MPENNAETTVTVSATITGNEYTESAWEEIDVGDLNNDEIDFLADVLGWKTETLWALGQEDRKPCRSCGTPMPVEDPPVCEACRRSEKPVSGRGDQAATVDDGGGDQHV